MRVHVDFLAQRSLGDSYEHPGGAVPIFVDYGDRNEGAWFDHHGLSPATASCCLVSSQEGVQRVSAVAEQAEREARDIVVVVHVGPDLDSVLSIEQVSRIAGSQPLVSTQLVDYVALRDRGHAPREDPVGSLALLFQAIRHREHDNGHSVVTRGIRALALVDEAIRMGGFHLCYNGVDTIPGIREEFGTELSDLRESRRALAELLRSAPRCLLAIPSQTDQVLPDPYRWLDGVVLDFAAGGAEPLGWKEYVRSDRKTSPNSGGYMFMAVRTKLDGRDNYCLSLDPGSRCSLKGLGAELESQEECASGELNEHVEDWSESVGLVAQRRAASAGDPAVPSLSRAKSSPRVGFANSDPWYDGRGHDHTIVDTPSCGSVLAPERVLGCALRLYDPLWREEIRDGALPIHVQGRTEDGGIQRDKLCDWLQRHDCPWSWSGPGSTRRRTMPRQVCLADALNSLRDLTRGTSRDKCYAVYLNAVPCYSRTLPEQGSDLYVKLALFLACHGLRANDCRYPRMQDVNAWYANFGWEILPGSYCAVSDSMAVMLDYTGECGAGNLSAFGFGNLVEQFLALQEQLTWTSSLSPVARSKKRNDTLLEFVSRQSLT